MHLQIHRVSLLCLVLMVFATSCSKDAGGKPISAGARTFSVGDNEILAINADGTVVSRATEKQYVSDRHYDHIIRELHNVPTLSGIETVRASTLFSNASVLASEAKQVDGTWWSWIRAGLRRNSHCLIFAQASECPLM